MEGVRVGAAGLDGAQLRLAVGGGRSTHVELLQYRTMGKVVWPAAHALAEILLESWHAPALGTVLLEVAAGAGLPSLVAARACGFSRATCASTLARPWAGLAKSAAHR